MNTVKENKNLENTEDKIAKRIANKDKKYSNHEIERLIKKEIKREGCLEEDWQMKHAVRRIKIKINKIKNRRLINGKILFVIRDLMEDRFNIFTVQYYDILITNNRLFLIKLPKGYLRVIGLIIGLSFNIFGVLLGIFIGVQIEEYRRSKYRRRWNDDERYILKKDIDLEIAHNKIKENITFNKKRIKFKYNNKEVKLKGKRKKIEKLRGIIN